MDIINRKLIEHKRDLLVKNIKKAREEYHLGEIKTGNVDDFVNLEVEKAWLDEREKRWRDIELERVQCISAEKVMKKARVSLGE